MTHEDCDCLARFTDANRMVAEAQRESREAKRDVVAWLVEHDGMTTRQAGEHLGISAMMVSRLLRPLP